MTLHTKKNAYDKLLECVKKADRQIIEASDIGMERKKIAIIQRFRDTAASVLDGTGSYDDLARCSLDLANLAGADVTEEAAVVSAPAPDEVSEIHSGNPATLASTGPHEARALVKSDEQRSKENVITNALAKCGSEALSCKDRSEGYGLKIKKISKDPQRCGKIAELAVRLLKRSAEIDISKQVPEELLDDISFLLLQILDQDLAGLIGSTLPFLPDKTVKWLAKRFDLKSLLSKEIKLRLLNKTLQLPNPIRPQIYQFIRTDFLNNMQGWHSVLEFVPALPEESKAMNAEQQAKYAKQLLASVTVYIQAIIKGYIYKAYANEYKEITKGRASLPAGVEAISQDPFFGVLAYGLPAVSPMKECEDVKSDVPAGPSMSECEDVKSMEYLPELNVLEFFIDEFRKKLEACNGDMRWS